MSRSSTLLAALTQASRYPNPCANPNTLAQADRPLPSHNDLRRIITTCRTCPATNRSAEETLQMNDETQHPRRDGLANPT